MAQAILDIHLAADKQAVLEEGQLPTIRWSGMAVDTRYVNTQTERLVEVGYTHLFVTGHRGEVET